MTGKAVRRKEESWRDHLVRRLIESIGQIDSNGCWLWGRRVDPVYALVGVDGKVRFAHRLAWVLAYEQPIPPKMCVLHACPKLICINPVHLFLGSRQDMTDLAVANGRQFSGFGYRGEDHPMARLNVRKVDEIRRLLAAGVPVRKIATTYGICRSHIFSINLGQAWAAHVTPGLSPPYRRTGTRGLQPSLDADEGAIIIDMSADALQALGTG